MTRRIAGLGIECGCGCGQITSRLDGKPMKFMHGHGRWSKKGTSGYRVNEATGCWEWIGRLQRGYGTKSVEGKPIRAHRYFWEQANGPIPHGLELDHLCRNRRCVNPKHLEAVTRAENARRGEQTRLTRQDVIAIRSLSASGITQRKIAALFGIKQQHVSKIVREKTWVS